MTLKQLIDLANRGYPDGELTRYCDERGGFVYDPAGGDSLAAFVVSELNSTFETDDSDAEQIVTAVDALRTAINDLEATISAFEHACVAGDGDES